MLSHYDVCVWFLVWQWGGLERGSECMTVAEADRNLMGGLWVPLAFALEEHVMAPHWWGYHTCTNMQRPLELCGPTALHFRGLSQMRGSSL